MGQTLLQPKSRHPNQPAVTSLFGLKFPKCSINAWEILLLFVIIPFQLFSAYL